MKGLGVVEAGVVDLVGGGRRRRRRVSEKDSEIIGALRNVGLFPFFPTAGRALFSSLFTNQSASEYMFRFM
jgi:hypothetical protein